MSKTREASIVTSDETAASKIKKTPVKLGRSSMARIDDSDGAHELFGESSSERAVAVFTDVCLNPYNLSIVSTHLLRITDAHIYDWAFELSSFIYKA